MDQNHDTKLLARFWTKVEKGAECWEWIAAKSRPGYGLFWIDGHLIHAHRMAYILTTDEIPEGMQIDHRCHNVACVNPDHLRLATNKQNAENRRAQKRNKLGIRGVIWNKRDGCYRATVSHDGNTVRKTFDDLAEANAWATATRNELFTHNDADRIAS